MADFEALAQPVNSTAQAERCWHPIAGRSSRGSAIKDELMKVAIFAGSRIGVEVTTLVFGCSGAEPCQT
jgi:hypothetical protein